MPPPAPREGHQLFFQLLTHHLIASASLKRRASLSEKNEVMLSGLLVDGDVEEEEVVAAEEEETTPEIQVRTNFNPLANFTASVKVDENGIARIPLSIPDNLTRYRYSFNTIIC